MSEQAVTITLKGKSNSSHWVIFRGDSAKEARDHIEEYFDIEHNPELTLNEVVFQAEAILQGTGNVITAFKGAVVSSEKTEGSGNNAEAAPVEASANEAETALSPVEALVQAMSTAKTVDDLRSLWVENKSLFDAHQPVKDAYSKRGKELTA